MKKHLIPSIIDSVLIFLVAVFLSLILMGYFTNNSVHIISAGLCMAICISGLITKKEKKTKEKLSDEAISVLNQFIFNEEIFAFNFIKEALSKKYNVIDKKTYLLVNSTAVFVKLKNGKLGSEIITETYGVARKKAKKLLILCIDGIDFAATKTLNSLPDPKINIFDGERVYALLKSLNYLPKIEIVLKTKTKLQSKELLSFIFSPEKSRRYFMVALLLLFSAAFMPLAIYYIIIASICIVLGIFSKLDIMSKIKKKKVKS